MGNTIRVRVRAGMLEPLEKIDLPEGSEISVTILDVPAEPDVDAFKSSFGAWKGTIDADVFLRGIRESRGVSTRPEPRL